MKELLNRLPIRTEHRLPLAIGCGLLTAGTMAAFCCGGCALLVSRTLMPAPLATKVEAPLQRRAEAARPLTRNRQIEIGLDATALLAQAINDEQGRITFRETTDGLFVTAGAMQFCKPADGPRNAARWREACDSLEQAGFIEFDRSLSPDGRQHFRYWRVTAAGYALTNPADKET